MKNNDTLNEKILINGYINLLVDITLNKLATIICIKNVLSGKDDESVDDRFDDVNCDIIFSMVSQMTPALRSLKSDSQEFELMLERSALFSVNISDNIKTIIGFKEESCNLSENYLDLFDDSYLSDDEVYYRFAAIFRVLFYLEDMLNGFEEYGINPYISSGDEEFDLLEGLEVKDLKQLKSEVKDDCNCKIYDFDSDERRLIDSIKKILK